MGSMGHLKARGGVQGRSPWKLCDLVDSRGLGTCKISFEMPKIHIKQTKLDLRGEVLEYKREVSREPYIHCPIVRRGSRIQKGGANAPYLSRLAPSVRAKRRNFAENDF